MSDKLSHVNSNSTFCGWGANSHLVYAVSVVVGGKTVYVYIGHKSLEISGLSHMFPFPLSFNYTLHKKATCDEFPYKLLRCSFFYYRATVVDDAAAVKVLKQRT